MSELFPKAPPLIEPRAVACMRGNKPPNTYDAEIVFWDRHYLVSTGHKGRREAMRVAEDACMSFRLAIKSEGLLYLANQGWKEAKP